MNRIIHVKYATDDPDRLTGFYDDVFGWSVEKFPDPPDGWRMDSGSGFGVNSSVYRSGDCPTEPHMSVAVSVDSVARTAQRVLDAGGEVIGDPIEAFGNTYLYCRDPDGNVICLVSFGR